MSGARGGGGEARVAEELGDVLAHGGGGHGEMEERGDLGGWGAECEKLALGEERVKVCAECWRSSKSD